MTAKTRLVDAVKAVVDPVTGGITNFTSGGRYPLADMGIAVQRNTAVVLGDSLVGNGVISSASVATYTSRNIAQIAAALLNQRLNVVADKGVSGERTDQWLARFDTDVAPYNPAWVICIGCSNDFSADRTSTQVLASLDAIKAKCDEINARMVFCNSSCGGNSTTQRQTYWYEMNAGCVARHAEQNGFFYAPMYFAAVDYSTSANAEGCNIAANMTYDAARHPSAYGNHTVYAQSVKRFFDPLLPNVARGMGGKSTAATGDMNCLVMNGTFYGATGTAGTGNSGTPPTLWVGSRTGSITSAFSVAARTDGGAGQWMICTLSASAAAADLVSVTVSGVPFYSLVSGLVGETVRFEVDALATTSSGTIGQMEFDIQILNSAGTLIFTAAANQIVGTEYLGITGFTGRLRTPDFVLPAGADRVVPVFKMGTSAGGAAVIKWGGLSGFVSS